ncbi:MAG: ATP-binding protein [Nitrospiraceae bacterium]|nr:ATP-binding protein [Nitrospiraceae bacterium]
METLQHIMGRIEEKKSDYEAYNFTRLEDNALTAFFDLAQEFDTIEDLYKLCVAVPKSFFGLEARLYLISPRINELVLMAKTENPEVGMHTPPPPGIRPDKAPYYTGGSLVLTIRGKKILMEQLPFKTVDNALGILEVYPVRELSEHNKLFFEKYANRIGFNLHNRYIIEKNIEHLRFIRSLVADIEHNIIVPNMIYRLFLRNLKGKISKNVEIEKMLNELLSDERLRPPGVEDVLAEMADVNRGLVGEFENINRHYRNMSLFLETLFRRDHFDKGHLTLRTKPCNMFRDVVHPQLERYADRFRAMGIEIDDRLSGIPDEEVITVVDVGLMAQVYANLFSNALKYTREVTTYSGEKKKYMSYGREVIKDFFGPGKDGIKYNVFSTGPHIKREERQKVFEDEYRGENAANIPGTGHGLAFIKYVIELHGGIAGYEPTQYGNNFYFILPR